MSDSIFQPRFSLDTPYLGDYFGIWMIHDTAILRAVESLQGTNLHLHMQSAEARQRVSDRDSGLYPVSSDGIARIDIRGPMMKAVPSMAEGTSTVRARQQLKAAKRDPEVNGVLLVMDTPGGTAKGNEDFAAEVASFREAKPIFAFIEDMTASAGVSVASQANKRYANQATAIYGAMGTYAVLQDMSGMAENLGVKVHVIRAGEFKGMATPGTEITEEQLAEVQRVINRLNESYIGTIARGLGRSPESILPLADGRIIMAADAVSAGLLDGIQTYKQTYAELVEATGAARRTSPVGPRSDTKMADKIPATLAELKATFPNSTAEWRESQLEAESSLPEASIAYARHVEAQAAEEREKHKKELEEAKNSSQSQPSEPLGHAALTAGNVGGDEHMQTGDAIEDFNAAVRQRLPKNREATLQERQAAIAYVARKQPELHQSYIRATNATTKRVTRLLDEKFETAQPAS